MTKLLAALVLVLTLATASDSRAQLAAPAGPDPEELMQMLLGEHEAAPPSVSCPPGPEPCILPYRFSGPVIAPATKAFINWLHAAQGAGAKMVMLELNTPGGEYTSGHDMARAIEESPVTVVCVVDGMDASMGFYLLQSCDRRLMTKRSTLMTHGVLAGIQEPALNAHDLRNRLYRAEALDRAYAEHAVARMTISLGQYLSKVADGKEWWIAWPEALKVGAIDAVYEGPPNKLLADLKAGKRP